MPQDPAGQQALIQRLYNAMSNLDGIETSTTRKYSLRNGGTHFIDSIGVKCVKDMNEFEMEMLAWDFLVGLPTLDYYFLYLPLRIAPGCRERCSERPPRASSQIQIRNLLHVHGPVSWLGIVPEGK